MKQFTYDKAQAKALQKDPKKTLDGTPPTISNKQ